jgi:hypothetical protein
MLALIAPQDDAELPAAPRAPSQLVPWSSSCDIQPNSLEVLAENNVEALHA